MTRRDEVGFWEDWLVASTILAAFAFLALHVPPNPVSSPGSGVVPAVTDTAGTSKP